MARSTSSAAHGKSIGFIVCFVSLVLLSAGVAAYIATSGTAASADAVWIAMQALAFVAFLFGIWLIVRASREGRVLKSGLDGQATITAVSETGMGVGGDGGPYAPILKIGLRVVVPGHPPYETSVREVVPMMRQLQLAPGLTVAVKADPRKLSHVVIDWERGARLGAGVQLPVGAPAGLGGVAMSAPALPSITLTGTETPDVLRAAVRQIGAAGTATVDAVTPAGAAADGRPAFLLGFWIALDGQPPLRVDNAPTAVEPQYAAKVVVGARVPVRVALAGGAQATVLLWDEA